MLGALRNQPLFVLLMGITGLSMYIPMLFAARLENWLIARTFFYHGTMFLIVTAMIGIAMAPRQLSNRSASRLMDLAAAFLILPALMAMPLNHLVPQLNFFQSYFEMVSSMTTTGATLLNIPEAVPDTIHLWRALVAWLGGFLMLVVALAIFMPINLGGFEVYSSTRSGVVLATTIKRADVRARLIRYSQAIFPIYLALTFILSLILIEAGERILVAVVHAMSTLSTSGISPANGVSTAQSGVMGEVFIAIFLLCAVSRFVFLQDREGRGWKQLKTDKEINMMLGFVLFIPLLLFIRHWLAVQEFDDPTSADYALRSFWGAVFTVLSFLTTTGFQSSEWETAQAWSGLPTPGLILMGLAVMGGGIATTAGGVKLLRVYALYKHGLREMERLSFPNSVGGSGSKARSIRREGAYAAWIFFMLFLISIAAVVLLLSAFGLSFEDSLVLAIASLSNTGPLLAVASDSGLTYAAISDSAKAVLCLAMVLGRLEALAVIAIFNPGFWRK